MYFLKLTKHTPNIILGFSSTVIIKRPFRVVVSCMFVTVTDSNVYYLLVVN